MSEHIKTGREIYLEHLEYSDSHDRHEDDDKQWVSLSWLHEQIQKERQGKNKQIRTVGYLLKNYNDSDCYEQYINLSWFLSLLEPEEKK